MTKGEVMALYGIKVQGQKANEEADSEYIKYAERMAPMIGKIKSKPIQEPSEYDWNKFKKE